MLLTVTRVKPAHCCFPVCKRFTCKGCLRKPAYDQFKHWKRKTKAIRPDPARPLIWMATQTA